MGSHERTVDEKNRVSIPVSLMNGNKDFVVAIHGDHLDLFRLSEWTGIQEKRLSAETSESDEIKRWLGTAYSVTADQQNRIRLNDSCAAILSKKKAKSAILVGLFDHVEIWPPQKWRKFLRAQS
ncbi:MAG: hypothetical protein Q8P06_01125 [Candidatus Azambacteria bacterium]|nr:hypothetical protein [Candidatus Azambacteria bacterium]